MTHPADNITVVTHHDDDGWWEIARRPPHPALAGAVRSYCGYAERTVEPLRRREVASGGATLILSFGDKIDVVEMPCSPRPEGGTFGSFVVGCHTGFAITEHEGRQHGVEVHLTSLGAHRLLGVPTAEVANQVVELSDIAGHQADEFVDRLTEACSWAERFTLVDRTLSRWVMRGREPDRAVSWAWSQLERSHGGVSIGALADEIGWSRRHFAARFREQVGLTPKAAARVLRFAYAVERLGRLTTVAEVAAVAGYADHSHLVHDFQALAGCSPTEYLRAVLPDEGGVAA